MTNTTTSPLEENDYVPFNQIDSICYDGEQLPPGVRHLIVPNDLRIARSETTRVHCNPNACDMSGDDSYEFVDFWELWGMRPQTEVQEVEAIGDSMLPIIAPGDRVFFSPKIMPRPGSLVVVWYHDNPMIKQLYSDPVTHHSFLYSFNEAYDPIPVTYSENIKVLGVAFDVHRSLRGNHGANLAERHRLYLEGQQQRAAQTQTERFEAVVTAVNNGTDHNDVPLITHCRDWGIVMRIMVEHQLFPVDQHTAFTRRLKALAADDREPRLSIRKLPADGSALCRTQASISGTYPHWRQPDDCDDDLWEHFIDIAESAYDAILTME